MKVLKLIIGVLAALFALIHAYLLAMAAFGPRHYEGAFEISRYGGHLLGFCIGAIVALVCFQRRRSKGD